MVDLVTATQMRAIEAAAIASGRVTGLELMERAATGAIMGLGAGPFAVLCGPGNNGGDGYAIARLLAGKGAPVTVFEMTNAPTTPDAAVNRRRWVADGGAVRPLDDAAGVLRRCAEQARLPHEAHGADLPTCVIDALFGTGLSRPLNGVAAVLARMSCAGGWPFTLCVDIPSGLCADAGRPLGGIAICAQATVTFHAPKLGHHLADGPAWCGRLRVVDIGLSDTGPGQTGAGLIDGQAPGFMAGFAKTGAAHKYGHGHALILSGGVGKGGAARLAARGALRIGAGLVTLGCPPAAVIENAGRLDAIMLRPIADAGALENALADLRINAVALGMGLGSGDRSGPRTRALVTAALSAGRSTVLDADALTVFADDPEALMSRLHPGCVLTPHMGEFTRLFPDISARLAVPADAGPAFNRVPAFSRLDAVRAAALRAGCTVLLKGPDTVIATEVGQGRTIAAVHSANYDRAAPWLATAGAGDVLAGIAAGLLARGFAPHDAACRAAWIHTEAARLFGPGLIAEDLPDMIPGVLRGDTS
jgi:hydroxyethylthiazole kinase-like uncharacterized protein yjeF